jgi:hypothetical protein
MILVCHLFFFVISVNNLLHYIYLIYMNYYDASLVLAVVHGKFVNYLLEDATLVCKFNFCIIRRNDLLQSASIISQLY